MLSTNLYPTQTHNGVLLPGSLGRLYRFQDSILHSLSQAHNQTDTETTDFCGFVERVNPSLLQYEHVVKLIDVLQRVADGAIDRLMIFEPPRHFKSETVSRLFTAYYLMCHPERWVGLNSYAAQLAYTLSRNARDYYKRAGGKLNPGKTGVEQWETAQGGGLWAAGVGGPITGLGFHLGIVDDPIKNAEEAASPTVREKQRDWYRSTFYTRQAPGAAIIMIQTRWHEDDLSGWLLSEEGGEDDLPEHWHIVNLPALAEAPHEFPATCTVEPDERAEGEALCPERYPAERLRRIERRVGSYFFGALYQQRPTALEGGLFKRGWFDIVQAAPAQARRVRYWDKAAATGGDYTAGVRIAEAAGIYYVEDVQRGRWTPGERERIIRQTAELDAAAVGHVDIWIEQEPGSGGLESAQASIRNLAGFSVHAERPTGDKAVRAEPLAAQAEAGNVLLLQGAWNAAYIDELCSFPYGAHDDQVDASSGAFGRLAGKGRTSIDFVGMP